MSMIPTKVIVHTVNDVTHHSGPCEIVFLLQLMKTLNVVLLSGIPYGCLAFGLECTSLLTINMAYYSPHAPQSHDSVFFLLFFFFFFFLFFFYFLFSLSAYFCRSHPDIDKQHVVLPVQFQKLQYYQFRPH